jgi:3-oxoacyl-[acyl-carrier protein] reductase
MTSKPLTDLCALVTGSSRGLGRVIAAHLGKRGAAVAVHGTTPTSARAFGEGESLEQVARDVGKETGGKVVPVWGDLTDEKQVRDVVAQTRAALGRIDILVNNAGGDIGAGGTAAGKGGKPVHNDAVLIDTADVKAVLDRNLLSCILVCREVAPEMMARKSGRIITVGSVAGFAGRVEGAIYATAKAGLHEYTRCLAAQMRPYNVPVNCVAPGGTVTARFVATGQADPAVMQKAGTLEGYGRAEDIAAAVEFFCVASSGHVSGQILRVDGGGQLFPA